MGQRRPVLLLASVTQKEKPGAVFYVLFRRRLILNRTVGMRQSQVVGLVRITVLLEPSSSATSYKCSYFCSNHSDSWDEKLLGSCLRSTIKDFWFSLS